MTVEVKTPRLKGKDVIAPSPPHRSWVFENFCFHAGMSSIMGPVQETFGLSHITSHHIQEIEASRSNYRKSRTTAQPNWNRMLQRKGCGVEDCSTNWFLFQIKKKGEEISQLGTWAKGICNYCTSGRELVADKKLFLSTRYSEYSLFLTMMNLPPPLKGLGLCQQVL